MSRELGRVTASVTALGARQRGGGEGAAEVVGAREHRRRPRRGVGGGGQQLQRGFLGAVATQRVPHLVREDERQRAVVARADQIQHPGVHEHVTAGAGVRVDGRIVHDVHRPPPRAVDQRVRHRALRSRCVRIRRRVRRIRRIYRHFRHRVERLEPVHELPHDRRDAPHARVARRQKRPGGAASSPPAARSPIAISSSSPNSSRRLRPDTGTGSIRAGYSAAPPADVRARRARRARRVAPKTRRRKRSRARSEKIDVYAPRAAAQLHRVRRDAGGGAHAHRRRRRRGGRRARQGGAGTRA